MLLFALMAKIDGGPQRDHETQQKANAASWDAQTVAEFEAPILANCQRAVPFETLISKQLAYFYGERLKETQPSLSAEEREAAVEQFQARLNADELSEEDLNHAFPDLDDLRKSKGGE